MSARQQWRKRVQRWEQSGLTAVAFAAEAKLNVSTLRKWKYIFDQEARALDSSERAIPRQARCTAPRQHLPLVEVQATLVPQDTRFEVELACGRRVRVPATYEADSLRRLLVLLEERK